MILTLMLRQYDIENNVLALILTLIWLCDLNSNDLDG